MKGSVKWYNEWRGFGYITGNDNKDIFVRREALTFELSLLEGDKVEYDIEDTESGPQAKNVMRLTDDN